MFSGFFLAFLVACLLFGSTLALAQIGTIHRGPLFSGAAEEGVERLIATPFACIASGLAIATLAAFDLAAWLF
jgi:hypothetical protein